MKKSVISIILTLALATGLFTGCGTAPQAQGGTALAAGGTLILSVNPEIAVEYDENGIVTAVSARNNDAVNIISSCSGLIGTETRTAVTSLVTAIGNAGYFVEEIEGQRRQIVLEIEAGSALPHAEFIDQVVNDIRSCVKENSWDVPMALENESDYGLTDYADTDYGAVSDYGVTDYDVTDYGTTDYDVTDYGTTDYDVTDYGTTDYDVTDYGVSDYNDGVSDYDSDSDYGESDYNDSDYGDSDYN